MKARLLAILAAATLAAGCGIQPTGVVPAGPGPQIRGTEGSTPPDLVALYFVADGRVIPVDRPAVGVTSPEAALTLLLKGPTADESVQGFTTFVPSEVGRVHVYSGDPPYLVLPFNARKLSGQAVNQLVCTAMAAYSATGTPMRSPGMNITGPEGETYFEACKSG
jgi:hypothetical protein